MRVRDLPRDDIAREHVGHPDVDGPAREVYEELVSGRGPRAWCAASRSPSTPSTTTSGSSGAGCRTSASCCRTTRSDTGWCGCSRRCCPAACSRRGARSRRPSSRCTTTPPTCSPCSGSSRPSRVARASSRADPPRTTRSSRPVPTSCRSSTAASRTTAAASSPTTSPTSRRTTSRSSPTSTAASAINFTYSSILPALHALGRELTPEEDEAIEILRRVLVQQQVELRMQPGDASMANNFAMCHSRSDFVDGADPERAATRAAGMERGARSRIAACRSGASSSTWRTRAADLGYDPVPGREGRDRDQRLQQRRRGPRQPVQGRAGETQARLTSCCSASRLLRSMDRSGRGGAPRGHRRRRDAPRDHR